VASGFEKMNKIIVIQPTTSSISIMFKLLTFREARVSGLISPKGVEES
jgi:hypothetical protein